MTGARGLLKLKLSIDNEPIFKYKTNKVEDLDNIFDTIKKKLGVKCKK